MYCQFLGHAGIASFLMAPSTLSFLMKFGIWVPNMIIFVHGFFWGGCLVQKISGNDSQSKKLFVELQSLISCNPYGQTSQNFYHMFSYKFSTRSYGWNLNKYILNHFVVNALELAVLGGFWRKNTKELRG